jgi:hypothetical protein
MSSSHEAKVRRLAMRYGYRVRKSRRQSGFNNFGEFRLIHNEGNWIALGQRFDASLEDIQAFFEEPSSASTEQSGTDECRTEA